MKLTAGQLDKIKQANLSNLVKKVKVGKTLTAAEHKLIEEATGEKSKPTKPRSKSQQAYAEWLSKILERDITRECVRRWKKLGWNLDDPQEVERHIRNQKRGPKKTGSSQDDDEDDDDYPDIAAQQIPAEIAKLESALIQAPDYEAARTISTKLKGLQNAFRLHVEMGQYVTRESQERQGLQIGQTIKQLILRIPAELPQALVGLEFPAAVKKCEDFADDVLNRVSEVGNIIDNE